MKPVATRNFGVRVTPGVDLVDDDAHGLVAEIFEVQLNWTTFNVAFMPFEPAMAPPFSAATTAGKGVAGWQTAADARVELFYHNRFVVTPYDPLAGQDFLYPSRYGAPIPGEVWFGKPWEPEDGVVFYTSTDQHKILTADLEQLLETHSERNFDERALDLQGRPVIDFLVDRFQASRLVPDELLHWLGLQRIVTV
jgi:hypothetical protein